jgi:hypothetical protein
MNINFCDLCHEEAGQLYHCGELNLCFDCMMAWEEEYYDEDDWEEEDEDRWEEEYDDEDTWA